jgi:pyruvate kinase
LDGTDAVMLSAESATGQFPVKTIEQMAAICIEAEKSEVVNLDTDFLDQRFERIDQAIALGALFTAHHLNATAIAALTDSGSTPIWMSRHNIRVPIVALTSRIETQRALSTYRNVRPFSIEAGVDRESALLGVEKRLKELGVAKSGDTIVLTIGEPMDQAGGTNTLKIVKVR